MQPRCTAAAGNEPPTSIPSAPASTAPSPPTARRSSASARTETKTSTSTPGSGSPSEPPHSLTSMADTQPTLLTVEPSVTPPRRTTSKGIGPGDIVEIDKRGRRFHALVTELEQLESGRFELALRPLDSRVSYRTASVREVINVWRRA